MTLPLPRLHAASPSAAIVLLHLLDLAGRARRRTVTTNRARIMTATGIGNAYTVTRALRVLQAEKLIRYTAPAKVNSSGEARGRYLKISFLKSPLTALCENAFSLWKGPLSLSSVNAASCVQSAVNLSSFSKEKSTTLPFAVPAGVPAQVQPNNRYAVDPCRADVERIAAELRAKVRRATGDSPSLRSGVASGRQATENGEAAP